MFEASRSPLSPVRCVMNEWGAGAAPGTLGWGIGFGCRPTLIKHHSRWSVHRDRHQSSRGYLPPTRITATTPAAIGRPLPAAGYILRLNRDRGGGQHGAARPIGCTATLRSVCGGSLSSSDALRTPAAILSHRHPVISQRIQHPAGTTSAFEVPSMPPCRSRDRYSSMLSSPEQEQRPTVGPAIGGAAGLG